jgi:Domain of unknown function (DUF4410)
MHRIAIGLYIVLVLAGCASTDAEVTRANAANARLPYPSQILVYDFAISPSEVSPDSVATDRLSGAGDDPYENAEREQLERQVAAIVAEGVASELRELGLPATRWRGAPPAGANIYAIEGQFVTIDEGNALRRMIIGFGAGGTEVRTLVQAYYISGGRKSLLGEAEVSAESSNKPGLAAAIPVGAAVTSLGTAAAVQSGIGVISEMNTDVQEGAEDTAEAIVELLKPRMEDHGWIDD